MATSIIENKRDIKNFYTTNSLNEFNSILSFISEICDVPYVYLNVKDLNDNSKPNEYRIGINTSITDDLLSVLDIVVLQNKPFVFLNNNKTSSFKLDLLNNSSTEVAFFAGFPIVNKYNSVIGSLSLMDVKSKNLSKLETKIIFQSITNIQSLINLKDQNTELQNTINDKTIQFEIHNANSIEITFQLDENGIITQVSKKWEAILGHKIQTIIGTNFIEFIHPDDVKICTNTVQNLIKDKKLVEALTYRIKHKNGNYVWHSSNLKIVKLKNRFYFIGNCRDITEYVESKQKLKEQKEFYIKILDRLPTDVAVFDNNHKYIYLNPTAIKNDELRKFIIGKDDFEYAIHTGRNSFFANQRRIKFLDALNSEKLIEWEDEINQPDGSVTTHNRKFNPVFLEDGKLEMMVGFGTDITESKQYQKEILESKKLIQSILKNVAVGILVQGPNSEIIENNQAACEMLGLSQDQLIGKTSFDNGWKVIHPDGTDFKPEDHPVPKSIKTEKSIKGIVMGVFRSINNDLVWLLVDAIPVFDEDNILIYVVCSFNNITNQKNAENALKISNERFLYSNKATSDVIWDWDLTTRKVFYGEGYYENFEYKLNNTINNLGDHHNLVHPLDADRAYSSINTAIQGNVDYWECEYRHVKPDNTYAIVKDNAYIVRDETGKAIRIIGAMKDITDERKLKTKLQQSEEQFKGAFNHSAAGMALINAEGKFIELNERLLEILGYMDTEMKSIKIQDIAAKNQIKKLLILKRKLDTEKISKFNIEIQLIHKNKTLIWTLMSVSLIKNSEKKYYIFQFIDVTSRKKIEDENKLLLEENNRNKQIQLEQAKNLYRLLANNTVDLVCLHNLDGTFKYVSPSIKKVLGYTPEELIDRDPFDFAHPNEIEYVRNKLKEFISNKIEEPIIARFKNRNNNYIWIEIKARVIIENGVMGEFQTSSRDITVRKKADEAIEKALTKERKLNELRTNLVSTISHEFRTPMTTIRTSAELINMYLEEQNLENKNRLQKRVEIITLEIDRIVELMDAVLTISKEDSGKTNYNPIFFNIKNLCEEIIDKNFTELANKREVITSFKGEKFMLYGDKNLMEYSLSNLLNNALKYSENKPNIKLQITSSKSICKIKIIDYGIGIPEEDQDKLFNTFYRASNTDGIQGTGLGLYIVRNFVEKNKGTVTLKSKLGEGTTAIMQFPIQKEYDD